MEDTGVQVNPAERLPQWVQRIADIGTAEGDQPEERVRKRMLMLTAMLVFVIAPLYAIVAVSLSYNLATLAIPMTYVAITAIGFLHFGWTKRPNPLRISQLAMYLVLPVLLQWTLGGFVNSSATIMLAITAPILALVLVGIAEARWWLAAFVALTALSAVLDPFFAERSETAEAWVIVTTFVLNILAVSMFAWLPLAFFVRARRRLLEELDARNRELEAEQERSERLLLNVLPEPIAERLKSGEHPIADRHDEVAVLFADIVDFTPQSEEMSAGEVVDSLNAVFGAFDRLAAERDLEKIKTTGDEYMVVAGAPEAHDDDAARIADMALAMREVTEQLSLGDQGKTIKMRYGIDVGPIVAGVIGESKFVYDLYGDTVNTASRMESHGVPDKIQVTARTEAALRGRFAFEPRGAISIKGKGQMETFFLERTRRPGSRS